jgi:AmmeMemoRadiSam system protein B
MTNLNLRKPVVAGQFYPASAKELKKQLDSLIQGPGSKRDVIACLLPHAGYVYSGAVAGKTISGINLKERIILLGPNHTGFGSPFSLMTSGIWQTPLGEVEIDSDFSEKLLKKSQYLKKDELAHTYEHSLEVELPFLQFIRQDFKIVPIILAAEDSDTLKQIGGEIARVIKEENLKDSTTIIASSDMTHYESQESAQNKDTQAIEAVLKLDENELTNKVKQLDISMCGYAPAISMISAAKMLGAKQAKLVEYKTSGDVTGDYSSVVGYAGIIIY